MQNTKEKASKRDCYSPKLNTRFISAPKTGWTSTRESYDFEWRLLEEIPQNASLFTIFRDPTERFFSSYKETMSSKLGRIPGIPDENYEYATRTLASYEYGSVKSISKYIEVIKEIGFFDKHQVQQFDYYKNPEFARQEIDISKILFLDFRKLKEETERVLGVPNSGNLLLMKKGLSFRNEENVKKAVISSHLIDIKDFSPHDFILKELLDNNWSRGRYNLTDDEVSSIFLSEVGLRQNIEVIDHVVETGEKYLSYKYTTPAHFI